MTVLNLNNASAHLGFKSCVTLRRLHRKGQLDDYRRVGPEKRAIYLETAPYGLPRLCEHVQKTRRAGLIHLCGTHQRGLRFRRLFGFDAMGATTLNGAAVGVAAECDRAS